MAFFFEKELFVLKKNAIFASTINKLINKKLQNMKRAFLKSILLAMVLPVLAQAQPVRTTAHQLSNPIVKTIVKELNYPETITYVETSTEHLFVYNDGYLNIKTVPISTHYSVNDFVIEDSYVFFCGVNDHGEGIFGMFEWNDLFNGTGSYKVTNLAMYSYSNSLVTELNRMVAYMLPTATELVAVGKTAAGRSCVAELRLASMTWEYRVGELDANSADNILDIIQTADRVVTAGYRTYGNLSFICVRSYDKTNIFQSSGPQNMSYGFYHNANPNPNEPQYFFDNSQLVMSYLFSNVFCIASYWKTYMYYSQTLSPNKGAASGYYTVTPNATGEVNHIRTTLVTQPYQSGLWHLRGLTKIDAYNSPNPFFLLQEAEIDYYTQPVSMVFDLDYDILNGVYQTGMIPVSYYLDTKYQSIGSYNSNMQYLMSGYELTNSDYLKFREGTYGDYLCMKDTIFSYQKTTSNPRHIPDPLLTTGYVQMTFNSHTSRPDDDFNSWIECPTKGEIYKNEDER